MRVEVEEDSHQRAARVWTPLCEASRVGESRGRGSVAA